jgi:hypothetical protein
MIDRRSVFCLVTLVAMVGCPPKDEDDDDDGKKKTSETTAAPTPTPTPTTPTTVKVEAPPTKPGIEPRVKAEVGGRADGLTGTTLAGGALSMQHPKEWVPVKGEWTIVGPPDKKAGLSVGAMTPAGPTEKLPAATAAMGLTACEWNPPDTLTIGKEKIPGVGADGVCTKGPMQVKAAYIAATAQQTLLVGAWDPDGDAASVFGAMRSVTKAAGGDATGIAACCAALRGNAKSAPPQQVGAYLLAAGACDAAKNNPQGRQALAGVRAMLAGAQVPSTCK